MNCAENGAFLEKIEKQAADAVRELVEVSKISRGCVLAVGCSSSEICGGTIGHQSSPDAAEAVLRGILSVTSERGIYIAAQCCEHLNRAIVVEREACRTAIECGVLSPVNVVPQPKAGGSFATAAYKSFVQPVVLEGIRADAGIDIGGTLIGMHIRAVAVPVRLSVKSVGEAPVIAARSRAKFIGGCRAVYDESLM